MDELFSNPTQPSYPDDPHRQRSRAPHDEDGQAQAAQKAGRHAEKVGAFPPSPFLGEAINEHGELESNAPPPGKRRMQQKERWDKQKSQQDAQAAGTDGHRLAAKAQATIRTAVAGNGEDQFAKQRHGRVPPFFTRISNR
jgi:hypothetical protein